MAGTTGVKSYHLFLFTEYNNTHVMDDYRGSYLSLNDAKDAARLVIEKELYKSDYGQIVLSGLDGSLTLLSEYYDGDWIDKQ